MKERKTSRKKPLTKRARRGRIAKLNFIVRDPGRRARKKEKKISKKRLTKGEERARIENVPPRRRVPCKLNNVTKRKHQTELEL